MNLVKLWALWLACYFGPMYAGDWYDARFNFLQCSIALVLLIAAFRWIRHDGIMPVFSTLVTLQIIANVTDYLVNLPIAHYNEITGTLNALEAFVLFGIGGAANLLGWLYGRDINCSDSDDGPRDAKFSAQGKANRA